MQPTIYAVGFGPGDVLHIALDHIDSFKPFRYWKLSM